MWKSDEAGVFIAIESVDTPVDYGASFSTISARVRMLYRMENLRSRGEAQQCRISFYTWVDVGGIVPTKFMERRMPKALSVISDSIEEFRQDNKVDEADRAVLATIMRERHGEQDYSEEELAILERGTTFFRTVKESSNLRYVESRDPLVTLR